MLFNSLAFLIFFPVVIFIYFSIPQKTRKIFLLVASSYFYMSFVPKYVLILFALITLDYFLAQILENQKGKRKTLFFVISIISNLGTLFFFKYFNFFNENIANIANLINWNYSMPSLSIILPLGLSFHVFQSLGYIVEVYKGRYKPERNYISYALYVMFFPQLVAGPIERPNNLLPQINSDQEFKWQNMRRGLERMLWGFFKKLVIADQLAIVVDSLYSNLPTDSLSLIVLGFLFTYQMYCDFSGYSDIAIGSAQVLGFKLSENFNRPFASKNIADFWRCWHMSLSNWLRDYLYYPLAMGWGKVSRFRLYSSVIITFTLIGLWHGANWTFAVFGALHGIYMVVGSTTQKIRDKFATFIHLSKLPKLRSAIKVISVFTMVSVGLIIFRSENLSQAWWIISHIISGLTSISFELSPYKGLGIFYNNIWIVFPAILFMEIIQHRMARKGTFYILENRPKIERYLWRYAIIITILYFGYFGEQTFIYFQF